MLAAAYASSQTQQCVGLHACRLLWSRLQMNSTRPHGTKHPPHPPLLLSMSRKLESTPQQLHQMAQQQQQQQQTVHALGSSTWPNGGAGSPEVGVVCIESTDRIVSVPCLQLYYTMCPWGFLTAESMAGHAEKGICTPDRDSAWMQFCHVHAESDYHVRLAFCSMPLADKQRKFASVSGGGASSTGGQPVWASFDAQEGQNLPLLEYEMHPEVSM
eukprot:GHUV01033243.1.p1 GENE.GHUV01033243.1~~GHUV01033243.1.p1  ORF type:complete len:215 (-),score=40.98 GHUV01033243.1:141-785(-)